MSKFMNRPPPTINSTPSNSTFVEKIMIGLDHAPAAFDLRGQLIGAGGANLHYIRNETGAIATLRGRGSLFIDPSLGTESPEAMHLYIEHARFEGLQSAKQLVKNLIETMQQELVHFQQTNPPGPMVQFATQQAPPIPSSQPMTQMSIPPPNIQQMLSVPPPTLQTNTTEPMNNAQPQVMQQQNFMQQSQPTIMSTSQQPPAILQSQTIIPQTVPIQLHQGNMVIQQQVNPSNINMPPPSIHIPVKQGSLVHLQAPPPTPVHLSQPPPNIVLNQAQTNYQYQYIQQGPIQTTTDSQQNHVTIQHIYQPQGIMQQSQQTTQFNQFTTQQRPQQTQQYIVQGNTAYMVPPPNMIQTQPPNIIFQASSQQSTSQVQLQSLQMAQLQNEQQRLNVVNQNANHSNGNDDHIAGKVEKAGSECNESPVKNEDKSENEANDNLDSLPIHQTQQSAQTQQPPSLSQQQQTSLQIRAPPIPPTSNISSITHIPPPIITMPPPMTCVQHIVGNTLITTSQPTQPQTHQIYNPVSIQQIQTPPQQQIHVSTQNGQHFLVNAQQWQPQQQFQQNGNIQSFHLTTAQPMRNPNNPNEIVVSNQAIIGTNQGPDFQQPQQQIFATTFNPHIPAPVTGMQVQLQPITSVAAQTVMQATMSDGQHQILESTTSQQHSMNQHQMMMQPPLPGSYNSALPQPPLHTDNQGSSPQPVPPPIPMPDHQPLMQPTRVVQKRKLDLDDDIAPQMRPRMGMGSNSAAQYINIQKEIATTANNNSGMAGATSTGSLPTSSSQDEQLSGNKSDNLNGRPMEFYQQHQQQQQHQQHQQQQQSLPTPQQQLVPLPPSSHGTFAPDNNRQQFYRMQFDARPQQQAPMSRTGPGPRFHSQNNRSELPYPPMRPQHMAPDNNFPRFGPPPPPPPLPVQQMYPPRLPPQPRFRSQQW